MKKIKRKKMINQLTDKHYDYIDRESQIKYIISKYYENMDKKDLAKCYRENIGKLHWPDIFVVHKNGYVQFMVNPEKEISNPNQLMLFNI